MSEQPSAPERRSKIVTIKGRRYRVREPAPSDGFLVLATCTTLLGPLITKIFGGQIRLLAPAVCPQCGAENQATAANGRWVCDHEVAPGQRCGTVWDQESMLGPDGEAQIVGLSYVLGHREWRAVLAHEIEQRITALEPRRALAFAHAALLGALDFEPAQGAGWVAIRDQASLDARLPNAMAIVTLLKAALECWILPALVDDWTDTALDSSTSTTRVNGKSTTDGASPAPPAPATAATRVPPRVRRSG